MREIVDVIRRNEACSDDIAMSQESQIETMCFYRVDEYCEK